MTNEENIHQNTRCRRRTEHFYLIIFVPSNHKFLIIVVNMPLTVFIYPQNGPKSITLKYFVVGHTFMSADMVKTKVKGEMKKMKNVCDWSDFTRCVQKAGQIVEMDIQDFKEHESGLTRSKASKKTRPLLDTVTAVRFEEGSFALNYKTSHSDQEYRKAIFLQKKVLTRMANNTYH